MRIERGAGGALSPDKGNAERKKMEFCKIMLLVFLAGFEQYCNFNFLLLQHSVLYVRVYWYFAFFTPPPQPSSLLNSQCLSAAGFSSTLLQSPTHPCSCNFVSRSTCSSVGVRRFSSELAISIFIIIVVIIFCYNYYHLFFAS